MLDNVFENTDNWELIEKACREAGKRKRSHSDQSQSLLERLLDCYVDSIEGAPKDKRFRHGVHLLDKVVLQDNLSTLIVNFYSLNEGYTLMLKSKNGTESETVRLSYEETEFLDYLDAQQLPPMLVDLLEKSQADVFYNGCVIVEVRDYRCSTIPATYDSSYVLLRPTCQTLVADVNALTSGNEWVEKDKINLEASLLLATQSPLCLDPSPNVFNITNQLHYHKNKFRNHLLQRSHKRRFRSYLSQNRGVLPACSSLKLIDFLAHHKHSQPPVNLRLSKSCYSGVDTWKQKILSLAAPTEAIQVGKFSKKIESSKLDSNSAPETVQEIVLEGEKTDNRNYRCRVTIQRRPADLQYLGELYLHEDSVSKETIHDKGKCCKFFLGSKLSAQRYLQQFQDLYTEEGRKSVKISSYIPSQHHAILQAQNKNKVKVERTASPCQGQSRLQGHKIGNDGNRSATTNNKVAVTSHSSGTPIKGDPNSTITVVQQDGQTMNGTKIPIIAGNKSGIIMSGSGATGNVTVQGNQYVAAIPVSNSFVSGKPSSVSSSSSLNQHDSLQSSRATSYAQVGAYVQTKVVALGTTAIPVVTTPIAPVTSKPGAHGSIIPGKFITANIKPGTQSIQPAGSPGAITLIQSPGGDQTRRIIQTSRILKKQPYSNVTIQRQPVQITQRSNNATIAQLGNAGILPIGQLPNQLGINVANTQLAAKVPQQQTATLSSSLSQPILQQPRQITAVNTSPQVTMVTLANSGTPLATIAPTTNRSTSNLAPIAPLQQPFQVRMVQFPQGAQSLQPCQIMQAQVPSNPAPVRAPGRPNLRRRSSHQSNSSQK